MSLKNSQYQAIMRQYDLTQLKHRHLLDLRRQEIIEKIPAYGQLETDITGIYASRARAAVFGESQPSGPLQAQVAGYRLRQQQLLEAAGYPKDYLELTFTCPDCHDTGFINGEKCHCFKQAMVDLLYNQSNIHEILKKENFNTFNINYYPDQKDRRLGVSPRELMQATLRTCQDFIHDFDNHDRNLLIYGSTGVGKTFLTNCIAKELLDSAHTVIYLTALQLVNILQTHTFGDDDPEEGNENMAEYILDCDLLIIDDLGTELNNSFVSSQVFLCINERLSGRKSTIISTNLSLDELQNNYSERITSRLLSNYEVLPIIGDDIRIKKAIS